MHRENEIFLSLTLQKGSFVQAISFFLYYYRVHEIFLIAFNFTLKRDSLCSSAASGKSSAIRVQNDETNVNAAKRKNFLAGIKSCMFAPEVSQACVDAFGFFLTTQYLKFKPSTISIRRGP